MKTKKESQNDQILVWLEKHRTITAMTALTLFGCFRLAARIHNLREQGHRIYTDKVKDNGKYHAGYILIK